MLDQVRVTRRNLPLGVPCKLAFGDVVALDTMIAPVAVADRVDYGEETIPTGDTPENIEQAWSMAKKLVGALGGCELGTAANQLQQENANAPFTVVMFKIVLEMSLEHFALESSKAVSMSLLFSLNPIGPAEIDRDLDVAFHFGSQIVKMKVVGFDHAAGSRRVRNIHKSNSRRMVLHIDGNQGYNLAAPKYFASTMAPAQAELLEQPCHMDDWSAFSEVIKVSNVPVMLDKTSYSLQNIDRAADIGARFVKLKLMKMGSLDELRDGLCCIRELGIEPAFGNGIASDLGCWMEACVALDAG